jgi:hypothetical protein
MTWHAQKIDKIEQKSYHLDTAWIFDAGMKVKCRRRENLLQGKRENKVRDQIAPGTQAAYYLKL